MSAHISHRLSVIALVLWLGVLSCADSDEREQRALLDGLPEEFVDHLVSGDDSSLAKWIREAGFDESSRASSMLWTSWRESVLAGPDETAEMYYPYMRRVARLTESEYHVGSGNTDIEYLDDLSADQRRAVVELRVERRNLLYVTDLSPEEKVDKCTEFLEKAREYGDPITVAQCKGDLAACFDAMGDEDNNLKYLHSACDALSAIGSPVSQCQLLGLLGSIHRAAGRIDSMVVYYEEARRIANRSRLPMQAPRISEFYASHYARQGRLSLAMDLYNEAIELCREYKGTCTQLRFIYNAMGFNADLGCWDVVEQLCKRARLLVPNCHDTKHFYFEYIPLRIDLIEARMLMARGSVEEAESLFAKISRVVDDPDVPYGYRAEYVTLLYHMSEGLMENGRAGDALHLIDRGIHRAEEARLPGQAARLALLKAKACVQLGDVREAERAIAIFDRVSEEDEEGLRRELIERDALSCKLTLNSKGLEAVIPRLQEALARMENSVAEMDAGVESYLWMGECRELRQVMHDITSFDATLGYGAELLWREYYQTLGSRSRDKAGSRSDLDSTSYAKSYARDTLSDELRAIAESSQKRIAALDAIHCTYLIRGGEVWRWVVTSAGIRRESLGMEADELRELVSESWQMMAANKGYSDAGLRENLRELARVLLPPEISCRRTRRLSGPLLVTTDGFLGRIPFEAFDLGENEDYTPLLTCRDIAYIRHIRPLSPGKLDNPGVIVVNSKPSKELSHRYPFQQELKDALTEGAAVASLKPDAVFLSGRSATKRNVQSTWHQASFIYMVAHMLRDPEVPYLMLVPLSKPSDVSAPDAAYLDITDIREADLRGCDVVVLSGCSSGAPYVETRNSGPSLGDAFLDAGAAAVVQTFWDVRDDEATEMMAAYIRAWDSPGFSHIRAICDARRQAMRRQQNLRDSFRWASYSINLAEL
jgi:CHAT domain-containing protein/tetratricopeptide (TPR) repeat protein